jgi:hypothetical protein
MVTESTLRQASTSRPSYAPGCVARVASLARLVAETILASTFLLLSMTAGSIGARAGDPPPGIYIYSILRDGAPVGQQRMEFVDDGEKLRVISHTELEVTLLGMSIYGYNSQVEEVRAGGKIMSLVAETDDDGKDKKVNLSLQGDRLKGNYNNDTPRDIDPALSTSLFWQLPSPGDAQIIDFERGKVRDVTVKEIGPETLTLPVGKVETRHFRISGEMKRDLWYDANGVLIAGQRPGPDGSTARLELQQRP